MSAETHVRKTEQVVGGTVGWARVREEGGRLDLGDGVAETVHLHGGTNEGGQEGSTNNQV